MLFHVYNAKTIVRDVAQMLTQRCRLPLVCHYRCRICSLHDLQNRTPIRQEERPHLPVHLLNRRLHLRHVR